MPTNDIFILKIFVQGHSDNLITFRNARPVLDDFEGVINTLRIVRPFLEEG